MTATPTTEQSADAAIDAACRTLHLPTVRSLAAPTAEQAARDQITHRGYLAELFAAETDARCWTGPPRASGLMSTPISRFSPSALPVRRSTARNFACMDVLEVRLFFGQYNRRACKPGSGSVTPANVGCPRDARAAT